MATIAALLSTSLGRIAACGAAGEVLALACAVARANRIRGFPLAFQIEIVLYTLCRLQSLCFWPVGSGAREYGRIC